MLVFPIRLRRSRTRWLRLLLPRTLFFILFAIIGCRNVSSDSRTNANDSSRDREAHLVNGLNTEPVPLPTVSPDNESKTLIQASEVIISGKAIGSLKLGDTQADALRYFGPNLADKYEYDDENNPSRRLELHWNDDKRGNRGVFVYLRADKIFLIASFTTRFKTENGIAPGDSPNKLLKLFPSLKAYKLLGSGSTIDGGKDLIYWIDNENGIAFGLYYFPTKDERRIKEIDVFPPHTDFLPAGNISPPQEWVKLDSFKLD